ncbi:30S ribosomal protein S19 [Candidatus Mesenet endosymbiont of Agriotes lineatus]|uniref:30S ribosomal protein S19 n=1 Tax=Candidatus Mesenet endosymbiont of Agriotes lineatus TaxID=3077948 RepID=UPI0030CE95D7
MSRSAWKPPFCHPNLFNEVSKVVKELSNGVGKESNSIIKTRSRGSTILPNFIGLWFSVYNGKKYIPILVDSNMVGHKLGEFSPTRTFKGHSGDKKVIKK